MSDHTRETACGQCGSRSVDSGITLPPEDAVDVAMREYPCRGFTLRGTDDIHPHKPHKCCLDRGHAGMCVCRYCYEPFVDPDVEAAQRDDEREEPGAMVVTAAGIITLGVLVLVLCGIVLLVRWCLGEMP